VADIFFLEEDLSRFDIVVIVKQFESFTPDVIRRLHARSTQLVYDVADIRFLELAGRRLDLEGDADARARYFTPFVRSMDALILASPLQRPDFEDLAIPQAEIARPLLNRRHRSTYAHGGPIRLIWQGFRENIPPMRRLHPIVAGLREETGLDIRLVYDTSGPARVEGPIEYTEWNVHRWEHILTSSDVGVVIKPLDDAFQQRKPPTKVISYMGAGLPVVCTPSEADRGVITHGETGFFAHDDREWRDHLRALVTDTSLRERVGTAARRHVEREYGVERIAAEYTRLFDRLAVRRPVIA
jgi:hypothetical protein